MACDLWPWAHRRGWFIWQRWVHLKIRIFSLTAQQFSVAEKYINFLFFTSMFQGKSLFSLYLYFFFIPCYVYVDAFFHSLSLTVYVCTDLFFLFCRTIFEYIFFLSNFLFLSFTIISICKLRNYESSPASGDIDLDLRRVWRSSDNRRITYEYEI